MTSQSSGRMGKTRALLLGVLVVLATVAVISTFSAEGPTDESQVVPETVEETVVEVTPLLPAQAITSASWRDEEDADARQAAVGGEDEGSESTSLLDGVEFGDEGDKRRAYQKNVEKTVKDIQGLGVYVAPETDVDEPDEPQKKKK